MRELGVFDIIGPVMIGPSSSHTAGALKIAYVAGRLADNEISRVDFTLYNSFARTYRGHGTDRALLGGILGFAMDDERIRDSFEIAEQRGIGYSFTPDESENGYHPNTVGITVTQKNGAKYTVMGESVGGGEMEIVSIDGAQLSYAGKYNAVFVKQSDVPGIISGITDVFARHNINIAFMSVYREGRGEKAYSIVEIDGKPTDGLMTELQNVHGIISVRFIGLYDGGANGQV